MLRLHSQTPELWYWLLRLSVSLRLKVHFKLINFQTELSAISSPMPSMFFSLMHQSIIDFFKATGARKSSPSLPGSQTFQTCWLVCPLKATVWDDKQILIWEPADESCWQGCILPPHPHVLPLSFLLNEGQSAKNILGPECHSRHLIVVNWEQLELWSHPVSCPLFAFYFGSKIDSFRGNLVKSLVNISWSFVCD